MFASRNNLGLVCLKLLKGNWHPAQRMEFVAETGMDYNSSVRTVHTAHLNIEAPAQQQVNASLRIGGKDEHCGHDEVAFRCCAANQPGTEGVLRRGLLKIFLKELPARHTGGAGQDGGGALPVAELDALFMIDSGDPLLVRASILHTDCAKTYRHIGPLH